VDVVPPGESSTIPKGYERGAFFIEVRALCACQVCVVCVRRLNCVAARRCRGTDNALQVDTPSMVPNGFSIPRDKLGWVQPKQEEMYASFIALPRGGRKCTKTYTEPTVFVTRFEFHNPFHISTDW
jgi:hypothetical protein